VPAYSWECSEGDLKPEKRSSYTKERYLDAEVHGPGRTSASATVYLLGREEGGANTRVEQLLAHVIAHLLVRRTSCSSSSCEYL